jgi:hypothetical protein
MSNLKLSLKEDSRPADLWYWNDWFSSFDVRACSLAARGLWVDMLGIMRSAEIKGTLTINGKQIGSGELAKLVGAREEEIIPLLKELEDHNVFSRLDDGTIINRRLYREGELSRKRAEAGRLRGSSYKQKESKLYEENESKSQAKGEQKKSKNEATLENENENNMKIIKKEGVQGEKEKSEKREFKTWCESIIAQWNEFAEKVELVKVSDVISGSKRERSLKARFKEKGFDFSKILQKIAQSDFLLGNNKKGWRITFDWLICPSNYVKVLEGNYDTTSVPKDTVRASRIGENRVKMDYPPGYWQKVQELKEKGFSGQALNEELKKISAFQAFFQKQLGGVK